MSVFFTADTHFGDRAILRTRTRFGSAAEHDEALVALWNETVGPGDEVWHLGDFAAGASRERCLDIFGQLHGTKRLIRGNHDTRRVLDLPWAEPPRESLKVEVPDGAGGTHRLFLAHYPHRAWPGLWRGRRHLHGHTHATLPDTRFSCDVGADAWDGRPVGLDRIIARQDGADLLPEELARDGRSRASSLGGGAGP